MSQDAEQEHITKKVVVYRMPGTEAVEVRRDVEYRADDAGALTADIYYPPGRARGARTPAVVFVVGYSDLGAQATLGCKLKEMGAFVSWARLVAASGLVAITYTTREPAADVEALLRHVRGNAAGLGVDENALGVWAVSGNVPLALSVLTGEARGSLKCAVLCYGYMLDSEGFAGVAEAAKTFGFVNPCAGKSVADLPPGLPLFVARAGRDELPRLNESIDCFVAEALKRNLPLTLTNHPTGPHAFDLFDDGETSREIIRRILAFMRFHLPAAGAGAGSSQPGS